MAREVLSKWLLGGMLAFACALAVPALAYADGIEDQTADDGAGVEQLDSDNTTTEATNDTAPAADKVEDSTVKEPTGNSDSTDSVTTVETPADTAKPIVTDEPSEVAEKTPQAPVENEEVVADPKSDASPVPEGAILYAVQYEPIVVQSATTATTSKTTTAAKTTVAAKAAPTFTLTVQAHVQNKGWMKAQPLEAGKGSISVGTHGKSLRVEEIRFTLSGGVSGGIQVQAHVQNVGWQTIRWGGAGKTISAGTNGKAQRIESIRIMLTGEISKYYDIAYNAHVQNIGWQKNVKDSSVWYKNGQIAGTSGRSLRIEELQFALVKKTTPASKPTDGIVGIRSQAHVQNVGWQSWVQNGQTAGTSGRSLRIEALKLALDSGVYSGALKVTAHIQNLGNRSYNGKSLTAGTTGRSLRMEAFKINLTGKIADEYDVVYRAHVQNIGWQPWVVNGAEAGTHGRSLRVEALQIKLVKKDTRQALSEGTYFISLANSAAKALDQTKMATFATNSMTERYYLRAEKDGYVSLQNVGTGKFLARDKNNNMVLSADSSADTHRWKLWWNGGYTLTNKAGNQATTASGKGVMRATGAQWALTGTALIPNGNYTVKNVNAAKLLDVAGSGYASYASNANLQVNKSTGKADQVFTFTNKGNNTFEIKSAQSLKAVEVGNASKAENARVRTWVDNNSAAQKWKATLSRKGGLQFKNLGSGKLLTAASTANESKVTSNSASAASNVKTQLWTLAPSKYKTNAGYARAYNHIKWRSSGTQYMFALDQTRTWLYIFKGSPGNWTLDRDWIVSVGRDSNRTPRGEFEIYDKQYEDGNGNYSVWYFTRFKWDNAFHSIKYDAGSMTSVYDGRLGQHISLGCVRQRLENARWIYYNAGYGTHVSSYD